MTDEPDDLDEDDIERLTRGTLINGDIPDTYTDPSDDFQSYFELFYSGVMIQEPDSNDTTFAIHPEGVPERGVPSIDFFYGRPAIYLYTPLEEEVQYVFALPTTDDPYLRPLRFPNRRFTENIESVEETGE